MKVFFCTIVQVHKDSFQQKIFMNNIFLQKLNQFESLLKKTFFVDLHFYLNINLG